MSKSVVVRSMGACLPERRLSNDDLASQMHVDTTDEWIRSHTGIGWRHLAAPGQTASELGAAAAREAMQRAGADPASVDLIVLSTTTPDFIGCPSTACLVQNKIGASNAMAFDIAAACSGYVYGMTIAKSMMLNGLARRALVVSAEVLSCFTDWADRNTCVLFGDGAGATLLELDGDTDRGILNTRLRADGSGWEYIVTRDGGGAHPYTRGDMARRAPPAIEMKGKKVYAFAVKALPEMIQGLVEEAGITLDDVKWIVPHQANGRIIQAAASQMRIPETRFFMNLEQRANTSSASIPIALYELEAQGGLVPGDLVLIVGFGSGLTHAGALIRW